MHRRRRSWSAASTKKQRRRTSRAKRALSYQVFGAVPFQPSMSEQQPKIMIFITILLSFSIEVTQSYQDCSTTQRLTDHYWSVQEQACLPCTRCHDQRLITLIGCAPDKDALCGTIEDLRYVELCLRIYGPSSQFSSRELMLFKKSRKDIKRMHISGIHSWIALLPS